MYLQFYINFKSKSNSRSSTKKRPIKKPFKQFYLKGCTQLSWPSNLVNQSCLPRKDMVEHVRQVFWLPRLLSGLPISLRRNSGAPGRAGLLSLREKGGVTAAGPLPIHTGFPIKPEWHLKPLLGFTISFCQQKLCFSKFLPLI